MTRSSWPQMRVSGLPIPRHAGVSLTIESHAGRMAWPEARVGQLAAELAEDLAAAGRFAESATLLADYAGDAAGAVGRLVQAEAWREALRTAYRFVTACQALPTFRQAPECPEAGRHSATADCSHCVCVCVCSCGLAHAENVPKMICQWRRRLLLEAPPCTKQTQGCDRAS